MTCQRCGNPLQPEDQFCGSCGAVVLPPAPQAQQVIPEPTPAFQGTTIRNIRRPLLIAGAVSALLLLVGGGAMALLGVGGEEVELTSGVSAKVPKGWAVDTLSKDGGGVSLVPKGYEGQKVESFMNSDTKAGSKEAYIAAIKDENCDPGPPSMGKGGRNEYIASGYDTYTNMSSSLGNGEATISGHPSTWGVSYRASAGPWIRAGSTRAADYPTYVNQFLLTVCVKDLDLRVWMDLTAALNKPSSEASEDKPTLARNATVPEAREEVHEELRQRYEANVGAMMDLLESIDTSGWDGPTDLSEIPTRVDKIDEELSDPFKGQLKDTGNSGTTESNKRSNQPGSDKSGTTTPTTPSFTQSPKEKTSPPTKGSTTPEKTKDQPSSTNASKAKAEEAAGDYYRAAGSQDWSYTFDNLDSSTKSKFTREEWRKKNQWFADNAPAIYNIESVDLDESSQKPLAEVAVRLTGEDGSSSIRKTTFVFEQGSWKHGFVQEENDLFKPGVPFDKWVDDQ